MRIIVHKYSTDGSSLSQDRCHQIMLVYDLCETIGKRLVTYRDIQDEAVKQKIFGFAKADSVIRTIFPLLKKIGFVIYSDSEEFPADTFFTDLGKSFIKTLLALEKVKEIKNEVAINKIENAREYHLCIGIVNLSRSQYKNHNILLALEILKREHEIYWNEFLYNLSNLQNGISLNESLSLAKNNRAKKISYEYVNESGKPIANTAYSYVRSFLMEAGIIPDTKSTTTKLNINKLSFITSLSPYEY